VVKNPLVLCLCKSRGEKWLSSTFLGKSTGLEIKLT
jgi:hypothetical protein